MALPATRGTTYNDNGTWIQASTRGIMTLPADILSNFPIPLARIVAFDSDPSPLALPDAAGDSYLCAHNPVFSGVRATVAGFGYRFSCADSDLWRDYQNFGLTTLHRILSGRVIPYRDSARTLRHLLNADPEAALSPSFLVSNLAPNRVFHESAHCIVHSVLRSLGPPGNAGESASTVLESVLAESFANTVETLGTLCTGLPIPDAVYYPVNSYVAYDETLAGALRSAAEESNERLRFTLYFLGSFEANLRGGKPDGAVCGRVAQAAGCDPALASRVTDMAFGLSRAFRENTTPQYFALLGLKKEYKALASAGWLGHRGNADFVRELVSALYESVFKSARPISV